MATIPVTITPALDNAGGVITGAFVAKWATMANGDVGEPINIPNYRDKAVQVKGTFGAGGSVAVEGSNVAGSTTNGDYATLNTVGGTALAITAAGIKNVGEDPLRIRPHVTAGDGTTALDVIMIYSSTARR